jgi:hypothetical protein
MIPAKLVIMGKGTEGVTKYNVIPVFLREVAVNCALVGYYAASNSNIGTLEPPVGDSYIVPRGR